MQKAASIVDQGGVVCYIGSASGRRVYQVQGHRLREHYTVFPDNYCSCQSFFYDIATKSEGVFVSVLFGISYFATLLRSAERR